jgi:hypothetical protein
MLIHLQRPKHYFQIAWVVPDLRAAVEQWIHGMGMGPFFIYDHVHLSGYLYRGAPFELDQSIAIAQAGAMQLELIQVHTEGITPFSEVIPRGKPAIHHIAVVASDLERETAEYVSHGYTILAEGNTSGVRFAMIDTWAKHGCMIELLADHPLLRQSAKVIANAAAEWDGTDPIRPFGSATDTTSNDNA